MLYVIRGVVGLLQEKYNSIPVDVHELQYKPVEGPMLDGARVSLPVAYAVGSL